MGNKPSLAAADSASANPTSSTSATLAASTAAASTATTATAATPGQRTFQPLHIKAASLPKLEAASVRGIARACQQTSLEVNQDITIKQDAVRRSITHIECTCSDTMGHFRAHEKGFKASCAALDGLPGLGEELRQLRVALQGAVDATERIRELLPDDDGKEATAAVSSFPRFLPVGVEADA